MGWYMAQTNKKTTNQPTPPFIEVLKQRALNQSSPDQNPIGTSLENFRLQKELEKKRVEQFHQTRKKEWSQVYSAKEKEIENHILSVREHLNNYQNKLRELTDLPKQLFNLNLLK